MERKFFVGVNALERHRRRLLGLWLEAKIVDSAGRRRGDDGRIVFIACPADVACLHRDHVWRLVADEAGLLKTNSSNA